MPGNTKSSQLAADIATALRKDNQHSAGTVTSRCLLMTGIAVAIMQTQSAGAVSLGELKVQSGLGQAFVASTTARIGPGESISSSCITAPAGGSDLGSPAGLKVTTQNAKTPGSYPVQIRSTKPLYEPMYEIRLQINCPGGVALNKNYVVMLNVPMTTPVETEAITGATTNTPSSSPATPVNTAPRSRGNRRTVSNAGRLNPVRGSIAAGETYRVRSGDTLSTISQRINGRPANTIWQVAEIIYSANPDAFIRGNRDMIKLGSVLQIPSVAEMAGTDAPVQQQNVTASSLPVAAADSQVNTTLGRPEEDALANEDLSNDELLREIREVNLEANLQEQNTAATVASSQSTADIAAEETNLQINANSPFADENREVVSEVAVAPQTPQEEPLTANSALPAQGAVNDFDESSTESGMNPLLAVLAGIGMGLLLALLILGRKFITPLLEGRARREAARVPEAQRNSEPVFTTMEVGNKPSAPAYGGSGIDVEYSEIDSEPVAATPEPEQAQEQEQEQPVPTEAPRVNLHQQETTAESDSSQANNLHSRAALEGTGTMRSLFDENRPLQNAEEDTQSVSANTDQLPELDESNLAEVEAESNDLDTLNRKLQDCGSDDQLSATLTDALGLLEQDYEDELTASQILRQQDVEQAIESAKKD